MTAFEVRQSVPADDEVILDLIRKSPQPGRVVLNFEREPSFYFGANVTCEHPEVLVVFDKHNGKLAAVGNIGSRGVYINGERTQLRYAHDLRVADEYRGSLALFRIYRYGKKLLTPGEFLDTVILAENQKSLSTVGAGRGGMPKYYETGDIQTSLVFAPPMRALKHDLKIRQASADDLPMMQDFINRHGPKRQFFPCYELRKLIDSSTYFRDIRIDDYWLAMNGDKLVGMVGAWNQKGFKQTRLLQYPGGLAWLRHLYNAWSFFFGGVHLPAAGGVINYRLLHTVLVEDDNPDVLAALMEPLAAYCRRIRAALVVAFFESDPLKTAVRKFRHQNMLSKHFLLSYDGDPRPKLDQRLPYVEVARL